MSRGCDVAPVRSAIVIGESILIEEDSVELNMAALAAMGGAEPQLTGHIKTAVDVAHMSKEEVAECFVHLMPYIGVPRTLAAMRCMKAAFGEAR